MYWNNMWDDKLNFSKKLKEDILINMFLFLIFTGCVYYANTFYASKNFYFFQTFFVKTKLNLNAYYNDCILIDQKNNIKFLKITKLKYKVHYIGKIWILRFQSWLLIVFHLYIPQTKKNFKKIDDYSSHPFKKNNKFYKINFFKKKYYVCRVNEKSITNATNFYGWYFLNLIALKSTKIDKIKKIKENYLNILY